MRRDLDELQALKDAADESKDTSHDTEYLAKLDEMADDLIEAARRYDIVRRMNAQEFAMVFQDNSKGAGTFDRLVDAFGVKQ